LPSGGEADPEELLLGLGKKTGSGKTAVKTPVDSTMAEKSHGVGHMRKDCEGCEMSCGQSLGPLEPKGMYLDAEVVVRTAPEEGVDLVDLGVFVEHRDSEADLGTLGMGCGSGSLVAGCAGLPKGCRCDWRPSLRIVCSKDCVEDSNVLESSPEAVVIGTGF
jgi:hypothetical protein